MNRIPKISKRLGFFHITFDNYSKNLHKNYSNVSTEKFETVYKFPYILPLSMVNRLKYYQTVVTVSFLPTSALIYKMNYLDIEMLKIIGSLGISGCLTLYSLGYLTQNFIGFIYYNDEQDLVQIAYIDFWGRRKDITSSSRDFKLKTYDQKYQSIFSSSLLKLSTNESFRINLRYGIVLDDKLNDILCNK